MKRGDTVMVFHDPISQQQPEGPATVVSVAGIVARWGRSTLYQTQVRFGEREPAVWRDVAEQAPGERP